MEAVEIVNSKTKSRGSWWWIVLLLIIVVAIGWWWFKDGPSLSGSGSSTYQAVFLDNNQVYFGKLSNSDRPYATLDDIFYLQVGQPLQPSEPATNVNLIKLGGELHGPADKMKINRDHILFIEDLKSDSQVVQAIAKYKEQQPKAE